MTNHKEEKKKTDYKPIKLTESEFRTLAGIDESKKIPKYVEYYLYKWDINIPCKPSDEIGYCYQYRKYLKRWFFLLSFVPFSLYRFFLSLWDYGLSHFSPMHRLIAIYEIKDGDEACNGIFNAERKVEFQRINKFWERQGD